MTEDPKDSASKNVPLPTTFSGIPEVATVLDAWSINGWGDGEEPNITLLDMLGSLLRHWRIIVGVPLISTILTVVVVLLIPSQYTATTSFVPEESTDEPGLPSGLAVLALQFGVGLGGGASSPRFYANLLEGRTVRDEILQMSFRTSDEGGPEPLLDILKIDGDSQTERLEKGRRKLDDRVTVGVDDETGIIGVSVETPYPELSAAVANRFVQLVNSFNLEQRQSTVQGRREFIESRSIAADAELRTAEDSLQQFLESNRIVNAPLLQVEYERLQRRVMLKQEILVTLRRQYEEAKIQEVNDTPVITVIDIAVPPDEKSSPRRTLWVIVMFLLGSIGGLATALAQDSLERARSRDDESFKRLSQDWKTAISEVRGLLPWKRPQSKADDLGL